MTRRSEAGSAGLLALILSAAFAGIGWVGLSPTLSHAEVIAAQATLQGAGRQLIVSPPATVQQARATLTTNDPGIPLAGTVATHSGLVGVAVGPDGAWVLAEIAGGTCVRVWGSSTTGLTESETPVATEERCVA